MKMSALNVVGEVTSLSPVRCFDATADARDVRVATMRHIAYEGRCCVLSCNQFVDGSMYPECCGSCGAAGAAVNQDDFSTG